MSPRTDISEIRIYRSGRNKEVLCRLTYEVTFFREGLLRWFLMSVEELE